VPVSNVSNDFFANAFAVCKAFCIYIKLFSVQFVELVRRQRKNKLKCNANEHSATRHASNTREGKLRAAAQGVMHEDRATTRKGKRQMQEQ